MYLMRSYVLLILLYQKTNYRKTFINFDNNKKNREEKTVVVSKSFDDIYT